MSQIQLKEEVIEKISGDALLFGKVANALNISPFSLPRLLNNNDVKLTQASVLKTLREHLAVKQDKALLNY